LPFPFIVVYSLLKANQSHTAAFNKKPVIDRYISPPARFLQDYIPPTLSAQAQKAPYYPSANPPLNPALPANKKGRSFKTGLFCAADILNRNP
jgi:hypothetical protein